MKKSTRENRCLRISFRGLVTEHSGFGNLLTYRFSKLGDYLGQQCNQSMSQSQKLGKAALDCVLSLPGRY